jgi:hypothetical protein
LRATSDYKSVTQGLEKTMMWGCRCAVFVLVLVLSAVPWAWSEDLTGRDIMLKQREMVSCQSEYVDVVMMLVDRDGNKRKRNFSLWFKKMADGLSRSLVGFHAPNDVAGTALLTWETGESSTSQWVFMPATKSMQRIAASSRSGSFMGSDFSYEDLTAEDMDDFVYTVTGEESIGEHRCHVIEVVPASRKIARSSGYALRRLWVRTDNNMTVRTEFYNRRGKLLKTWKAIEMVRQGNRWLTKKSVMKNARSGHMTLMAEGRHEFDLPIEDEM